MVLGALGAALLLLLLLLQRPFGARGWLLPVLLLWVLLLLLQLKWQFVLGGLARLLLLLLCP